MRPFTKGPRSLTRTSVDRLLSRLITRRRVPKGSERCAAVSWFMSKSSPLAVRLPWCWVPYQEATPTSSYPSAGGPGAGTGAGRVVTTAVEQPARKASAGAIAAIRSRARHIGLPILPSEARMRPGGHGVGPRPLVLSGVS